MPRFFVSGACTRYLSWQDIAARKSDVLLGYLDQKGNVVLDYLLRILTPA